MGGINFGALMSGFMTGYKFVDSMQNSEEDRAYKRQRTKYLAQQADPELHKLKMEQIRSVITKNTRGNASLDAYRAARMKSMATAEGRMALRDKFATEDRKQGLIDRAETARLRAEARTRDTENREEQTRLRANADRRAEELHQREMNPPKPETPNFAPVTKPPDAVAPQSAIPGDEEYQTSQLDDAGDPELSGEQDMTEEDTGAIPSDEQSAARGGLITRRPKRYDDGGEVEPDEVDDPTDDEMPTPVTSEGDTEQPDEREAIPTDGGSAAPTQRPQIDRHAALEAAQAGLDNENYAGPTDVSAARRTVGIGAGAKPKHPDAMTGDQMSEAIKKIDPAGTLTHAQALQQVLGQTWKWHIARGEFAKADVVAHGMVQHLKGEYNSWAGVVKAAAEHGNVDHAVQAAIRAYDNVPDGHKMTLMRDPNGSYQYSVTDDEGKVTTRQVLSPQQILKWAAGDRFPKFEELVQAAVKGASDKGGAKDQKLSDATSAGKQIKEEDPMTVDEGGTGKSKYSFPENHVDAGHTIATNIRAANTGLGARDALKASSSMLDINQKLEGEPNEKTGGATIKLSDGRTVALSKNDYIQVMGIRGRLKKSRDDTAMSTESKRQAVIWENAKRDDIRNARITKDADKLVTAGAGTARGRARAQQLENDTRAIPTD